MTNIKYHFKPNKILFQPDLSIAVVGMKIPTYDPTIIFHCKFTLVDIIILYTLQIYITFGPLNDETGRQPACCVIQETVQWFQSDFAFPPQGIHVCWGCKLMESYRFGKHFQFLEIRGVIFSVVTSVVTVHSFFEARE